MLETVARSLIKMMGHSGTVPSSLALADIPPALERLKRAVAANPDATPERETADTADDRDNRVSLSHRAQPLIDLLEKALAEGDYVIWDR